MITDPGVTQLLIAASRRDRAVLDEMLPLVYAELCRLADAYLRVRPPRLAEHAIVHARMGNRAQGRRYLADLRSLKGVIVPPYKLALVHGALGETDRAFEQLDSSQHSSDLMSLRFEAPPAIRHGSRFELLLRRVGIPVAG